MPPEKNRHQLLTTVAAFRLEKGRWPQTAFELASFARAKGRELDLSPFHLLRFGASGPNRLTLDWTLAPDPEGWADCGWLFMGIRHQGEDLLGWGAEWAEKPKVRVELPACVMSFPIPKAG